MGHEDRRVVWRRIAGGLCLRETQMPYAYVYVYDSDDVVDLENMK
jgi:hypothetical protein